MCVQVTAQANTEWDTESTQTKAVRRAVALLQGAAETAPAEETDRQGGTQLWCLPLLPGYPSSASGSLDSI